VLSLRSFAKQAALVISSAVRGFHVYKDIWKPSIGDKLSCEREFDNCFDKFAIKVVNNRETVGHLPCKFSKIAWYRFDFIWCFGDDSSKITDFFPDVLADKPHPRF